jgi:hypothetical protein
MESYPASSLRLLGPPQLTAADRIELYTGMILFLQRPITQQESTLHAIIIPRKRCNAEGDKQQVKTLTP